MDPRWRRALDAVRVDEVLAPESLERAVAELARSSRVEREAIGRSERGHELVVTFVDRGHRDGDRPAPLVLFYGFPDPGEGLGASAALGWMRAILEQAPTELRWAFLPVLDQDGQVERGQLRRPIWSETTSIDLVSGAPRAEARALRGFIERERPRLTVALHDEWHSAESRPLYFLSDRVLPASTVVELRGLAARERWPLDASYDDPEMGSGFLCLANLDEDFRGSVWDAAGAVGRLFASEYSEREDRGVTALCRLVLESAMVVLDSELGSGAD